MKFMNLSPTADLYSKLQSQITVLNQNVLYITHVQDKILKLLKTLVIDKELQEQANKIWEETSHQTDSDEQ